MVLPVGGSLPLHAGAVSKALLAFEPQEIVEEVLRTKLPKLTPKTKTSRRALLDELREIAEEGEALSDEDVIPGIGAIGVPVFGQDGRIRASLSIAGPHPVVLGADFERIRDLTHRAGEELSRRLGYVG
jgi:DNA-binding IclR family transcriptional regulator